MNQYNNPRFTAMKTGAKAISKQSNNSPKRYKGKLNYDRLPAPAAYYKTQFPKLKIRSEWVAVPCCFHEDKKPSLNISMVQGHFKCHACGVKGGSVLKFHMLRYNLSYPAAAQALDAWEVNHD